MPRLLPSIWHLLCDVTGVDLLILIFAQETPTTRKMEVDMQPLPVSAHPANSLREVVATLIDHSRMSRRDLIRKAGLSKDQVSRALRGSRALSSNEAIALLDAAGLPAKGALTLVLYGRLDLASDWATSGLAAFLETLVDALPEALQKAIGDASDRVDPRWGTQAARFVAQRIATHIGDLVEREERLGDYGSGYRSGERH